MLAVILALAFQAPAPTALELLPPWDDPEQSAPLMQVYAAWRAGQDRAEKSAAGMPKAKREKLEPQMKARAAADVMKRYGLADADWRLIWVLSRQGRWDAAAVPPGKPPKTEEVRAALDRARRAAREEDIHYNRDMNAQRELRGLPIPSGGTYTSDSAFRAAGNAARVTAGQIPVSYCKALNRIGHRCMREVPGGGLCWIHREIPEVKLAP